MALNLVANIGAPSCTPCYPVHYLSIFSATVKSGGKVYQQRLNYDVYLNMFSLMFGLICVCECCHVTGLRVRRPVPAFILWAVTMTAQLTLCNGADTSSIIAFL